MILMKNIFFFLIGFMVVSCAWMQKHEISRIQMEPLVILVKPDPITGLETFNAYQLLQEGNSLFQQQKYELAIKIYDRIITLFDDSEHLAMAYLNKALALENLKKYSEAITIYEIFTQRFQTHEDYIFAKFRLATSYAADNNWTRSVEIFDELSKMKLDTQDYIEAVVSMNLGLYMLRYYEIAESGFAQIVHQYEDNSAQNSPVIRFQLAQAFYYLGEIYQQYFEASKINLPDGKNDEEIQQQLESKCQFLLRAQTNYIKAIRQGNFEWATRAGFRIGNLYETFYNQLKTMPKPSELSEEQHQVYFEELLKKIAVLIRKAIKIYERSIDMAKRVGVQNEWVQKTEENLRMLEKVYLEQHYHE